MTASIDVQNFLTPVTAESPCGANLEYDPEYLALKGTLPQTPEHRQVETGSDEQAAPTDWRTIEDQARELFERTRDLQVATILCAAVVKNRGLPGLHGGLLLIRELLERFWDEVHPRLDPTDGNDPTRRMNILGTLAAPLGTFGDRLEFLWKVREIPLVESRRLGRVCLRDIEIAASDEPPPTAVGETHPDEATIAAVFEDAILEDLVERAGAAEGALQELERIRVLLDERVGEDRAPEWRPLRVALVAMTSTFHKHLSHRGIGEPVGAADATGAATPAAPGAAKSAGSSGEIRSPQDVRFALERICRYYEQYEPSSPVPLLLRRAQRLVSKRFVDIVQDLTPNAISDIELISGEDLRGTLES